MNEAEYLACDDPAAMLAHLQANARPSERKLRLFAVACCRACMAPRPDPRALSAVDAAERYADGLATVADLDRAWNASLGALRSPGTLAAGLVAIAGHLPDRMPTILACLADAGASGGTSLLREVFGNPFRPVGRRLRHGDAARAVTFAARAASDRPERVAEVWTCPGFTTVYDRFRTAAVLSIARRAYDERDFVALPVLADALEEAGCEDGPLLWHLHGQDPCPCLGVPCCQLSEDPDPRWREAHTCALCRGTGRVPLAGPHVAGCWALDLILGRE